MLEKLAHRLRPFAARHFGVIAFAVWAYTLPVILWGAYVRASGSGAGCGAHWPLCNGEVVPEPHSVATVIELAHRTTSGLAWLAAALLALFAFLGRPPGHAARRFGTASLVLMTTEALVGAGIVLLGYVANDPSIARGVWMAVHLANTFLLLSALTATALVAGPQPTRASVPRLLSRLALLALFVVLLASISGAVAALGDTLFPSRTLAEALAADLSPVAHIFVRLRVFHPLLALLAAATVLFVSGYVAMSATGRPRALAAIASLLVLAQVGLGLANVTLLAPISLQIAHLAVADAVWITLTLLFLETRFAASPAIEPAPLALLDPSR